MRCHLASVIFFWAGAVPPSQAADPGDCWAGDFTEELCCVGTTGNPICWDGGAYTFERCCLGVAPTSTLEPKEFPSNGEGDDGDSGDSVAVLFNEKLPDVLARFRHGATLHRQREHAGRAACPQDGVIEQHDLRLARDEAVSDVAGEASTTPALDAIYHQSDEVFVECPQAVISSTLVRLRRMLTNLLDICSSMEYFRRCQANTPFMLDLYIYFVIQKMALVDTYSLMSEGPPTNVTFQKYARSWPLGEQEDTIWLLFARLWRVLWSPRDHCACVEDYDYYVTLFANAASALNLGKGDFARRVMSKGTEAYEAIRSADHCEEWLTKDFQRLFSSYAKHSACLPGAILENVVCMTRWVFHGHVAGVLNTAEMLVKILTLAGTCLEDSKWPFTVDDVQYNFAKLALNWEDLDVGCKGLNRLGQKLPRDSPCPDEVSPELLLRVIWSPSPLMSRSGKEALGSKGFPASSSSDLSDSGSLGSSSSSSSGSSSDIRDRVTPGCTADFQRACIVNGGIVLPPDQAAVAAATHPSQLPSFMEAKAAATARVDGSRRWTVLGTCTEVGRSTEEVMIAGSEDDLEAVCEASPPAEDDVVGYVLNLPETSYNIWHNFHWLIPAVERVRDPSLGLGDAPQDRIQLILRYEKHEFSEYEWAEQKGGSAAALFTEQERRVKAATVLSRQQQELDAWTARQWPLLKLISSYPPQLIQTVKLRRFTKLLWGHNEMRADRELLHPRASTPTSTQLFRQALWSTARAELNHHVDSIWGPKDGPSRMPRLVLIQRALADKRGFENLEELAATSLDSLQYSNEVAWQVFLDLERRTILQQAAIFASSDVMVAAVGAAMAWMVVMEPGSQVLEWLPRHVPPSLYRCSELWNEDPIGMFGGLGRLSGVHHVCLRSEAEPLTAKERAKRWRGTKSTVTDAYWRKTNLLVDPPKFHRWVADALRRVKRFSSKFNPSTHQSGG